NKAVSLAPNQFFQSTVQSLFGIRTPALITGWIRVTAATDSLEGFQVFLSDTAGGVTALPARKTPNTKLLQSHIAEQTSATGESTDLYTGLSILNPSDSATDVTVSVVSKNG